MKFYIIPLFISICILFLVLRKDKTFQKYQRVSIFMMLAMGSFGLICAVIMMFQKNIELVIPVFLLVAFICQYSASCFMNLQQKRKYIYPKGSLYYSYDYVDIFSSFFFFGSVRDATGFR